jgi:ribonuclease HII
MTYLLGMDEAGYGPNLGPLIVSGTLWYVPDRSDEVDLYRLLPSTIQGRPAPRGQSDRLTIADSKALYKSGSGLDRLELGVLAALSVTGPRPATWRELWTALDPATNPDRERLPWYAQYDAALPVATDRRSVERASGCLQDGLDRSDTSLCWMQSTTVYPERLNQLIQQLGSKGAALSQVTLKLVSQLLGRAEAGPVLVVCDKHGGRNRYGPLLQQQFPDFVIEVHQESRAQSVYRSGPRHRRIEFRFCAKGEQHLPSALASMVSKYLRELSMMAWNAFWRQYQPDLRPTAGYPVDARRFKADIAELQVRLAIDDRLLWRTR